MKQMFHKCVVQFGRYKVGVLGAGHLGKIHLRLLQESKKYELIPQGYCVSDMYNL